MSNFIYNISGEYGKEKSYFWNVTLLNGIMYKHEPSFIY